MSLEPIKEAIRDLSDSDRRQLAEWITEVNEQAWDAEIERDFGAGGAGEAWLDEVQRQIDAGTARPQ